MKNFKLITLAFLAVFTFTTSCSSDDDSGVADDSGNTDDTVVVAVDSEFVLNGVTYPVAQGIVQSFGDNGNGTSFDFDITLFSDTITFDPTTGFSGAGEVVYLDLNSDNATSLSDGTYVFAVDTGNFPDRNAFTVMDNSFGAVNFDTAAGTADAGVVATTGSVVELTIEGGVYTIMYDILGGDGTTNIIGSYQGTLTSI